MRARARHHVPKSPKEGVDLGADGGGHAVARHQVDVLPLGVLRHLDPGAPGDELHQRAAPEEIGLLGENQVQNVGDVVLLGGC